MAKITFENGQVVEFEGQPTPAEIKKVIKRLGVKNKQPIEPTRKPSFLNQADDSILKTPESFFKGFGKDVVSTALGAGTLLNKLGKGIMALPALTPGGETFTESFDRQRGFEILEPGSETSERAKRALEAKGTAENVGKFTSSAGQFFIPGTQVIKTAKEVGKIAGAGKTLSKTRNLAGRALTEGVGFGAVEAVRKGGIDEEVVSTGILAGATTPALKVLNKIPFKKGLEKISDILTTTKRRKFFQDTIKNPIFFNQAKKGEVNVSTVAKDIEDAIHTLNKNIGEVYNKAQNEIISKTISTNNLVSDINNSIRNIVGLEKGQKIDFKTLDQFIDVNDAKKIINMMSKTDKLLKGTGKEKSFQANIQNIHKVRQKIDETFRKPTKKLNESNQVYNSIRSILNKAIDKVDPVLKKARATFSKDKKDIDIVIENLTGITPEKFRSGDNLKLEKIPNKVRALLNKIKNDEDFINTKDLLKKLDEALPNLNIQKKLEGIKLDLDIKKMEELSGNPLENLIKVAQSGIFKGGQSVSQPVKNISKLIEKLPKADKTLLINIITQSQITDSN